MSAAPDMLGLAVTEHAAIRYRYRFAIERPVEYARDRLWDLAADAAPTGAESVSGDAYYASPREPRCLLVVRAGRVATVVKASLRHWLAVPLQCTKGMRSALAATAYALGRPSVADGVLTALLDARVSHRDQGDILTVRHDDWPECTFRVRASDGAVLFVWRGAKSDG